MFLIFLVLVYRFLLYGKTKNQKPRKFSLKALYVMSQSSPSATGAPGFDLIKCPGGPGFDRGGEVAKNRWKRAITTHSHRLIASVYNNRLCLNKRAGTRSFLKSKKKLTLRMTFRIFHPNSTLSGLFHPHLPIWNLSLRFPLSFKQTRPFLLTYRTSYLLKKYKFCTSCEN